MRELEFLHQYTDAARESTDRTRKLLLIMIVASILVFIAYWNTRGAGWVNSRLNLAKATDDILRKNNWDANPPANATIPVKEEKLYKTARTFIERYPKTAYQAQESLFWTQKIRTEQVSQIQVPVLGISFDVNDLGFLGGVTFTVLLLWVNYSLWHHSNNLRLAFDFARKLDGKASNGEPRTEFLYHTYQNLAMRQVLTVPPRPLTDKLKARRLDESENPKPDESEKPDSDKLKVLARWVSKSLYALPVVVQTIVVINDWLTREVGNLISPWGTKIVLFTGSFFLLVVAFLTATCYYRWTITYNTWKDVAQEI